ncbi:xanthine dehydrogenase [Neobacillus piezotolerans]|uniref:Xanthine dehydrogenase n=1 Tax=Neobacillus piezotolerans TaxID=2259171 RepID=A0A3D8GU39_9BACI|nr:nucleotidyltransferase family protein [Neobacillus piezotolerans]RDU37719.1 xanthine dehydrogenase [Neobacillus piezotolerans]
MKIDGVYLAAGCSRRMGTDKRMLPLGGLPLGSIALKQALLSRLDFVFVVTRQGDRLDWLPDWFVGTREHKRYVQVECDARKGQGSSLSSGIKKAAESGADAVMVLLADQPFVTFKIIDTLIDSFMAAPSPFVGALGPGGNPMPPILFSSECFSLFENLEGDRGIRDLIRGELKAFGRAIEFKCPRLFIDLDTMEEYKAIVRQLES